jgi:hypothetical protein
MNQKGSKRLLFTIVAIFLLLYLSFEGAGLAAYASSPAATVRKVSGVATVTREGRALPATVGLGILENDTIRTGRDGSIGIVFNDETLLSLGPESVLVIDEFVFAPKQGKFSIVIRMLKGTAAYLSGLISRLAPESAHFKTPTASIGIRGTKFVAKIEGE